MPNNGIISKQAVIPSSFIVESAEATDLVIINTPLTGSKVEQKAVPVSAIGGGSPYYSYVVNFKSDGNTDAHEVIYSDLPETIIFNIQYIPGVTSRFKISNDENAEIQINLRDVQFFSAPLNSTFCGVQISGSFIDFSDSEDNVFSTGFFYVEFRIYKNRI